MEKSIKNNAFVKVLAYILLPICIIIFLMSVSYMVFMYENSDRLDANSFEETEQYWYIVSNAINNSFYNAKYNDYVYTRSDFYEKTVQTEVQQIEKEVKEEISQEEGIEVSINVSKDTLTDVELKTENTTLEHTTEKDIEEKVESKVESKVEEKIESKGNKQFYEQTNTYASRNGFEYIIINNHSGDMYTNVYNYDLEESKAQILSQKYLHIDSNGISQGNGEDLNLDYLNKYTLINLDIADYTDYEMYICFNDFNKSSEYHMQKTMFDMNKNLGSAPVILFPLSTFAILVLAYYIISSIGHKRGEKKLHLTSLDNAPTDILAIASVGIAGVLIIAVLELIENFAMLTINTSVYISIAITVILLLYIAIAFFGTVFIKKLKAKTFFSSMITVKILQKIFNYLKTNTYNFTSNLKTNVKIVLYLAIIGFIGILMILLFEEYGLIIDIFIIVFVLFVIFKVVKQFKDIENAAKKIYEGEKIKLDSSKFIKDFEPVIKYLNDVSDGFNNAVEEKMKSERLKTELITNVSHDIKTPLTSIINYVDLLKNENIKNVKAKDYIEVLDSKSQRLKKMIDDLVEASKASSGNVKLNKEKINIEELINQAIGEFQDKFESKKLTIITKYDQNKHIVTADSRYTYRIIENLFGNISKYAEDNTRVYIDIEKENDKNRITIKNISKEKLNISSEELMQRFVRGDASRNTEGSGLGLSISRSLTELQGGKFDIVIDGDLFKVIIIL